MVSLQSVETHESQPFETCASPPSIAELCDRGFISFYHPGYESQNLLLVFPCVDPAPDDSFGVHHGTALVACQIIANNAFDGRLARDAAGEDIVNDPLDVVLTDCDYWFFANDDTPKGDPYPVTPSFRDWAFPHGKIPDPWTQARLSEPVFGTPSSCSITGYTFPLEHTYLVPPKELIWFTRNAMDHYLGSGSIDNPANLVTLRTDIRDIFNSRMLVVVPKMRAGDTQFVTQIMDDQAGNYMPMHNTVVRRLHLYSRPFLFARFAWAVLQFVRPFICRGVVRSVVQVSADDNGAWKYTTKELSGAELRKMYGRWEMMGATPRSSNERQRALVQDDDYRPMELDLAIVEGEYTEAAERVAVWRETVDMESGEPNN